MKISEKAALYAKAHSGGKYSRKFRYRDEPYTRDCSSFVDSAYKDAGHLLRDAKGNRLKTSMYQPNDPDFELIYPATLGDMGKRYTSVRAQKNAGYEPKAGDLIFYNTISTPRRNKITHVAIVTDENKIMHARSTSYGIRPDNIAIYGTKVVAITRLKDSKNTDDNASDYNATIETQNGGSVNVRDKPSTAGKEVGKLNNATRIVVDNDFAKVKSDGYTWSKVTSPIAGYVADKYITRRK